MTGSFDHVMRKKAQKLLLTVSCCRHCHECGFTCNETRTGVGRGNQVVRRGVRGGKVGRDLRALPAGVNADQGRELFEYAEQHYGTEWPITYPLRRSYLIAGAELLY